jgi:hypothetical protein
MVVGMWMPIDADVALCMIARWVASCARSQRVEVLWVRSMWATIGHLLCMPPIKTDTQIYTLLGAAPEFLRVLTGGIAVRGLHYPRRSMSKAWRDTPTAF